MDQQPHDYGAPLPFSQQANNLQQQQSYAFHPQHQQFPPFLPPHPSFQQFPYPRPMQQSQLYLPHPHLHQPNPPSFPPYGPPHLGPPPFHEPYDSAPPPTPTPPPSDPELQKRIDKLVEYTVKNGPEFESVVRNREQENPAYSFLFGGEGHSYYQYKLWMATRPMGGPFNNPTFQIRPQNSVMGSSPINASGGVSAHLHQPPFPPFYEQQQQHPHQSLPFAAHGHHLHPPTLKNLSRPLPPDVEMELSGVLNNLTGTKESIKGAKTWFMQRSSFAPALAEAFRDRVFGLEDSERQLHIVYLANDILFDSLQRRVNPHELDNEAFSFKPVLGSMLARIYHNLHNKEENQSRLQKILQFWASKEVFNHETISGLEKEMISGPTINSFPGPHRDVSAVPGDFNTATGLLPHVSNHNSLKWQPDNHSTIPNTLDQEQVPPMPPLPPHQFHPTPTHFGGFSQLISAQPSNQPPQLPPVKVYEPPPPYPLFPPGLIPGMVKKTQIGSGVPYSPLSPLDIPNTIPPSNISPEEVLDRVSKFFREIGEVNPFEGTVNPSGSTGGFDYEYERGEVPERKGGACIPPPPGLNVGPDPDTGTLADGSFERKPGSSSSGRLGLGATADPNEPSQYDDVYSSYRKHRSTNYHTSMSTRASTK